MINWNTSKEEMDLIQKIVARVNKLWPGGIKDIGMDITATHLNGCSLRLRDLIDSDDMNFVHDVGGIVRNLNRETGKLENCFSPKFSE